MSEKRIRSAFAASLLLLALAGCRTIGVARENGGYAVVSPQVANEMILDNPTVVILDFRPTDEYRGNLGHLAGAIAVPLDHIEQRLPELVPYTNSTVLVYGGTADEAQRGARLLVVAGFRNVVLINGGIDRWIELGYKTVTSS
jgi:rhodanese-related sulfurtransferase